ncbi:MAG: hypothetical protein AB7V46_21585 [Thermomicrobiales bacterium]
MAEEIRPPKKPVLSFEVDHVIEVDEVSINLTPESGLPASSSDRSVLTFDADEVLELTEPAIMPDENPPA